MRIALLTNSKLSVPAIGYLAERGLLASIGVPSGKRAAEDLDHVNFVAAQYKVPVEFFSGTGLEAALLKWLEAANAAALFVFTFPFKLPSSIINMPEHGALNFHFGILPQYRGADAIFWQIRNREKEGGVSIHKMTDKLDCGPLYIVHKIPIAITDTYGSHLLNLSMAAVPAMEKILVGMRAGTLNGSVQDETRAAYYHRPSLNNVMVDWNLPAKDIIALINACNPWNKGAVAYLDQYPIKIIAASEVAADKNAVKTSAPGTVVKVDENRGCYVCCGSGELLTLDILYCNDSFITGTGFAKLGIRPGVQFSKHPG